DLATIAAKAMAKNPDERYATAQDFAEDLKRFLEDRPILARRPGLTQRMRKWSRRHRPLVVSLTLSAALLLAGWVLGLAPYANRQAQHAAERDRLAREKEAQQKKTAAALYRPLLGRAHALRLVREPGYRRLVWADLREAAALDPSPEARAAIRAEALACLGDPIGLDPVEAPVVARSPKPKVHDDYRRLVGSMPDAVQVVWATTPDGRFFARFIANRDFAVGLWRGKHLLGASPLPLGALHDLQFAPDGMSLIGGCDEGIVQWSVPTLTVL